MMARPTNRRTQVYLHKSQMKYAIGIGVMMFLAMLIAFGIAFLTPHVLSALNLMPALSLEERSTGMQQLLFFAQTMWPALIALVLAAAAVSMYTSHRVAGPLYRLQQDAIRWKQGDLSFRIRLRKGDEEMLQELAELLNQALMNLEKSLQEIRQHSTKARQNLRDVLDEMKGEPSPNEKRVEQLKVALEEAEQIDDVFMGFKLSPDKKQNAPPPPKPS
ncbi:MAG: methyl-accepting chemotaxis protein [Nitrospirales bacterium]